MISSNDSRTTSTRTWPRVWLAQAQRKLGVRWGETPEIFGTISGRRTQELVDWLFAPSRK